MKNLIEQSLGDDWQNLPTALKAHYAFGTAIDQGVMDINYPTLMQPVLSFLGLFGVLVNKRGTNIPTTVEKKFVKNRHNWKRTIQFPDGKTIFFNSFWVYAGDNQVVEFVNPFLGLQLATSLDGENLKYDGVRFILKLGFLIIPIPEWLLLGHTTIIEKAISEQEFVMDFRLTHPLFGEVFRYSGQFSTTVS